MLAKVLAEGVQIHFGVAIIGVDASKPALLLDRGREIKADLIIGADGIRSKIRQSLFPSVELDYHAECAFYFQLPFSSLQSDAAKEMMENPIASIILGPGTGVVVSPIPSRNILDLQFLVSDYAWDKDKTSEKWHEFTLDMADLRNRYAAFGGVIPEALTLGKGVWKWRFAECSAPEWHSQNLEAINDEILRDAFRALCGGKKRGRSEMFVKAQAKSQ